MGFVYQDNCIICAPYTQDVRVVARTGIFILEPDTIITSIREQILIRLSTSTQFQHVRPSIPKQKPKIPGFHQGGILHG